MKSRGLVVAIAVVLAVLAAVGVIVYTSGVRENAITEGTTHRARVHAGHPGEHAPRSADLPGRLPDDPGAERRGRSRRGHGCRRSSRARPRRRRSTRTSRSRLARISSGASNILGIDEGNIGARAAGGRTSRGQWLRPAGRQHHDLRHVPPRHAGDEADPASAAHARAVEQDHLAGAERDRRRRCGISERVPDGGPTSRSRWCPPSRCSPCRTRRSTRPVVAPPAVRRCTS